MLILYYTIFDRREKARKKKTVTKAGYREEAADSSESSGQSADSSFSGPEYEGAAAEGINEVTDKIRQWEA